ncbi:MAG: MBL fold metallo-hydrolase [Bacillota bacterium]|jgi:7,8-dihydropterin-6-yl-methyl-4-(beta-D-ribofuranosyl)aminobenzene 5'-phosphate synthase
MIIRTLVENTSISQEFNSEHGLSLYIETKKHKLLFDVGCGTLFIENAQKMGIDLAAVDLLVISHGHYDHGGGLKDFLQVNTQAKIYLQQKAFDKYFANRPGGEKVYIGLDKDLLPNERFFFVGDQLIIDEELTLFSNVQGKRFASSAGKDLLMELDNMLLQDDFAHEQNLIIKENATTLLLAGCAHKGIVNIVDHFRAEKQFFPDHVIAGFHLYNPASKQSEDPALVGQIGRYLKDTGANYYTCHCTGIEAYKHLKEIMEEKIQYLATGSQLVIY